MAIKKQVFQKLKSIEKESNSVFLSLLKLFSKEYSGADHATAHIRIDLIESMFNAIKALEYQYRDNGLNGRVKKHYPKELKDAHKLLKKYAENSKLGNIYSDLVLKEKFDGTGIIAQRNRLKR